MAPVQIQPHGNEDATMAVSAVVIVLAVISVALRFYTRIFTRSGLGADDWLILSAVVATLVTAALLLWGMNVPSTSVRSHLIYAFRLEMQFMYSPFLQATPSLPLACGSQRTLTLIMSIPLMTYST